MSIFTNPAASSKEDAAAYTNALLDLLGARPPFDVLQQTPTILRETVGVDSPRLATPESPGKWSVRHVLAHLADSEVVFAWRLRMILAHERPPIQGYDQDAWANSLRYGDAAPEQSLEAFGALRGWNLRLLKSASPQELQRAGVHSERGEETVEHLMKLYAAHDLLHIRQVQRILATV
jgi:hypothetical protein